MAKQTIRLNKQVNITPAQPLNRLSD